MNISLFSQNLSIFVNTLAVVLLILFIFNQRASRKSQRFLAISGGVSVVLLLIATLVIKRLFTLEDTPHAAYIIFFLIFFTLCLVALNYKSGYKTIALGLTAFATTLIFGFLVVNNYYHYYSTINSIFNTGLVAYGKETSSIFSNKGYSGGNVPSVEQLITGGVNDQGKIYEAAIPSPASHFAARNAIIYLPPAYINHRNDNVRFPVLVLLTGTPGSPTDWTRSIGFGQTMSIFASRHSGVTPIVILADHSGSVWNDTECVDSPRGNVETYLSIDVPNFIKSNFTAAPSPDNWGIGGFSEGGMCAAMLTLRHQDVFRHFLDMSGEPKPNITTVKLTEKTLFGGSKQKLYEHDIDWLLEHSTVNSDITGRFVIGSEDTPLLIKQMRHTYTLAKSKNLNVSMEIIPGGGHSFSIWAQGFKDSLPIISYDLGATTCEVNCRN